MLLKYSKLISKDYKTETLIDFLLKPNHSFSLELQGWVSRDEFVDTLFGTALMKLQVREVRVNYLFVGWLDAPVGLARFSAPRFLSRWDR